MGDKITAIIKNNNQTVGIKKKIYEMHRNKKLIL